MKIKPAYNAIEEVKESGMARRARTSPASLEGDAKKSLLARYWKRSLKL